MGPAEHRTYARARNVTRRASVGRCTATARVGDGDEPNVVVVVLLLCRAVPISVEMMTKQAIYGLTWSRNKGPTKVFNSLGPGAVLPLRAVQAAGFFTFYLLK